ncbi:MAG TPA: hypothetical protein VES88_12170 [Gemmatimonadaceae bacterium]|nr:hypothetical protein [Gemmatimonadaceae bacterium]
MGTSASASVSLSAKIPDPTQFLSLVESLSGKVSGVHLPVMPTAQITSLVTTFKLELPDPKRWSATVTADSSKIAMSMPDPSSLIAPLERPIAAVKDIAATDFAGAISDLTAKLQSFNVEFERDPEAFVKAMFTPSSSVAAEIRNSPFMQVLMSIGRLIGEEELAKAPERALEFGAWLQQLLQDRIGSVLIAFVAAGEVATMTRRLVRAADLVDASVDVTSLQARREAARAAMIAATAKLSGVVDEVQVRAELGAARVALDAWIGDVSKALAFGEASAGIMGIAVARERFARLGESTAKVNHQSLNDVATSLGTLIETRKTAIHPSATVADELDATVRQLLLDLKGRIDAFDVSSIEKGIDDFVATVTLPIDKLEAFKRDVEREVRGALETIRQAITAVDVTPLRAEFDGAMHQVEATVGSLAAEVGNVRKVVEEAIAAATAALQEAHDFVLHPEHGLKAQIDAVFAALRDLLTQLNIQGVVDDVTGAVNDIARELERIELAPVIDATVSAIDTVAAILDKVAPLLVTDDLRAKLSEATDFLRQVDFDEIRAALQEVLDGIINGINTDALGKIEEEYNKAVAAIGKLDPTPVLEGLQTDVFDPLIEELSKIKPAEELAPIVGAFAEAIGTLRAFDPTESLRFLIEFHHDIRSKFDQVSPDKLLEPVVRALTELRQGITKVLKLHEAHAALDKLDAAIAPVLEAVDLATWFGHLDSGLTELRNAIATFDPAELLGPLASALREAFDKTGAVLDKAGLASVFEALAASGDSLQMQLEGAQRKLTGASSRAAAINVAAIIDEFRPLHAALSAAVAGASVSAGARVEFAASVAKLEPLTAWAGVQTRAPRAERAIATVSVDFGTMLSSIGPTLAMSQKVIDTLRILRRPIEALWELALNPLRSIVPIPEGAGVHTVLLAVFDALDPRKWNGEIKQLSESLVAKLRVLLGATAIAALRRAVDKVSGLVDGLNIDDLVAALRDIHTAIEAQINALDPEPLLATLKSTYDAVVGATEAIDPGPFVAELDTVYSRDVIGLVEAISPRKLLLEPLKSLFEEISAMLGALDIGELFGPVLEQLQRLRTELLDGITRAGASYESMLNAIPTEGGGVSASVSVG